MPESPATSLEFLRSLRPVEPRRGAGHPAGFSFMISAGPGRPATLDTVDRHGRHIDVHPDDYDGPVHALLKTMSAAAAPASISSGWGRADAGDADTKGSIDLSVHPALLFQLALCPDIVDGDMNPVTVSRDTATVKIVLDETAGPDGSAAVQPSLVLSGPGLRTTDFSILSGSFALASGKLYRIKRPGDNYAQIPVFLHPFDSSLLESYLSVLFTYLPGIEIEYKDYMVERSSEPITVEPTLVIEKLGADKALYLRLAQGIPGKREVLADTLGVSVSASVSASRRIVLRPVRRFDMAEKSAALLDEIRKYAPTRAAAKDIYHDRDGFFIVPQDTAAPFLLEGIPSILSRYEIVGTDKLRDYKLSPVLPKVNLRVDSGIDFLEGDASVDLGGETMPLADMLEQYRSQRYVLLSDGSRGIIDPAFVRRIERIFRPGADGSKMRISFFDLPEVEQLLGERLAGNEALAHPREFYAGFNSIARGKLSLPDVKATLRPYQEYGVKWLLYLYANRLGGCLADDMGLGKTLQTIAFISKVQPGAGAPSLIVMPRSLLFNWEAEFRRFAPSVGTYIYYGQSRDLDAAMRSDVILTTYALVRNDIEQFSKRKFHTVVLDEAQNIKNISAGVTKAVQLLDTDRRFALSGTPIENNLMELYSLFRFLNPAMFGSADDYARRYATPIQQNGDPDALADLRRRIFPFMLRRLKSEVLGELPDRMDQTLAVDMDTAQARLYEQRRRFYLERVHGAIAAEGLRKSHIVMFQALSELRRIASVPESLTDGKVTSSKMELLADHIIEANANGHKSVVFFNFIAGIEIIGERLDREEIDYACMTGSTADRRSVVERFQTDPACRVLLMTLKTGGVGLNLTAADTVFIVEPWWNRAAEEQAVNRLHRFGQTSKVSCYTLVSRGTIEEKIRELQQRKSDLFHEVITADSTSPKLLTEDDINFILS